MQKFDLAVIGGGPGGYVAAIRGAQLGAKVALVEKAELGGTCLNRGCIPTKSLIASAELLEQMRRAADFGVKAEGEITPDWPAMLSRKNKIVKELRQGIAGLLKANQVTVFKGIGSFDSRRQLQIAEAQVAQTIEAERTIVATGSRSAKPGFVPQADNVHYSTQALNLAELPEDMIILGGGVIGCEFACLLARLGVQVTLVEMLPEILPMVDPEAAAVVRKSMKKLGIKVLTGQPMREPKADGREVTGKVGGQNLRAAAMLVCVGRQPCTQGLQPEKAGLRLDEPGFLPVDGHCRTAVAGIYAIGDLVGGVQYAHRASAQAMVAAENALGGNSRHSDALVPGCIFTAPEIGAVGLTEEECEQRQQPCRVGKFPFAALGKARIHGATEGFCKIIADRETDQVLGVHIVGPHATDLIAEAATAMHLEITAGEMARAMHAHPTLGEATMEAAHAVHGQCIHLPPPR